MFFLLPLFLCHVPTNNISTLTCKGERVKENLFSACGQLCESIAVWSLSQGDLASIAKTRRNDLPSRLASVSELCTNTLSSESKHASR